MKDILNSIVGVHLNMPSSVYHADPCPEPSLSASVATIITQHSPYHARLAHPKLNPAHEEKSSSAFDFGRAMHAAVLEPEKELIVAVEFEDWRTKDAKNQKDALQALGRIPVLLKQYDHIQLMAAIAREFMRATTFKSAFFGGNKEVSLVAYHDNCWLRGRLDCISNERDIIFDYKTVLNANPDNFVRTSVFSYGYDIQAAMYIYLNKLLGFKGNCRYFWILQEKEAPYCCSLIEASDSIIACGMSKINSAKIEWLECLRNDSWPAYGYEPYYLDAPSWELEKAQIMNMI